MSNIYVPIDSTNLKEEIPPEEDILYSTMCKVMERYQVGTRTQKDKYKSHILITNKKVYYLKPQKKTFNITIYAVGIS
jgi:hypothetical protein